MATREKRFAALHSHQFRALWLSLILSNVGGQMQSAAQAWLVHELYPAPYYLGLLTLSMGIPLLVLTPLGGAIADRYSGRLLRVTRAGMALQGVILAVLSLGGWIGFWHILLLSFFNGTLLAIDNPARQALIPEMVRRDQLPSAISLSSVTWSSSSLIGPALGGLLLIPLGVGGVFLISAFAYVAILVVVSGLPDYASRRPPEDVSLLSELWEGIRFVRRDSTTLKLLILVSVNNVLGRSYTALMPVFAREILGVGPEGYGLLLAAPGGGALAGAFGIASLRKVDRPEKLLAVGWFGFALCLALFSLSHNYVLSIVILLATSALGTLFNASASTILQLRVPPSVRGRVLGLQVTSSLGGVQIGGTLSGIVATAIGAPAAVAAGAAIIVGCGILTVLRGAWHFPADLQSRV